MSEFFLKWMNNFHSEGDAWIGSCPLIEIRKQDEVVGQY